MSRPLRINYPGAWYHVMNRGIERREVFGDDRDRIQFVEYLGRSEEEFGVEVHGYCLMDNHYHLALHTPEGNLSQTMRWFGQSYTQWFNRRYNRVGPLFQGRFKSISVDPDDWLTQLSVYIHLNPLRLESLGLGKLANHNERLGVGVRPTSQQVNQRLKILRNYRWSSYRAYAGYGKVPEWLKTEQILSGHGRTGKERRANYRKRVQDELERGVEATRFERFREEIALGSREFIKKIRKQYTKGSSRETEGRKRLRQRISLEALLECVEKRKGEPRSEWLKRYGDQGKWMVLHLAKKHTSLTLSEIGQTIGGMDYSAISNGIIRFNRRLVRDPRLRKELEQIAKMCNVKT